MNSHQAAAAAKEELPILYTDNRGDVTVYRRIKALTYHYYPKRKVSLLLEDRRYCQWNTDVPLESVQSITSCDECPDKDNRSKSNCGKCRFVHDNNEDHFICISSNSCTLYNDACRKKGSLCSKYGDCKNCMIYDDHMCPYTCCAKCIYHKDEE